MRTLMFMVLLGAVAPLAAQESEKFFCFRPGPGSSCRSYALFALRGQVPLIQGQRSVEVLGRLDGPGGATEETRDVLVREELGGTVSWDLGYAVNVNEA